MKRLLVIAVLVLGLSGCYWRAEVESYEVGLLAPEGVKIEEVVREGRYTDWGWYAEIHKVDASAKSIDWEDPDLVTRDKQPIAFTVTATYRRPKNTEGALLMWNTYRGEAQDDAALAEFVMDRIPRAAKAVTTQYSLDEMLGIAEGSGREQVTALFHDALQSELDEAGIKLLDVGINNIGPDEEFLRLLQQKANAGARLELSKAETAQLEEQLSQEKAQTDIDLEKARRNNLVAEEAAKVLEVSDRAYELQRLEKLADVLGDSDKVYFIPEGADISLFIGATGTVVK